MFNALMSLNNNVEELIKFRQLAAVCLNFRQNECECLLFNIRIVCKISIKKILKIHLGKKVSVLDKLHIAKAGYIFISFIFYAAGLIYLILPEISVLKVCVSGGIILIAYGIIKIIGYFSDDLYCLAFQHDLGCGLLLVVIGIIVIVYNTDIKQQLSSGMGLLILFDSMLKMQTAYDARVFGLEKWYLILIFSVIASVFGVLMILMSFIGANAAHIINGLGMFAEGFMNHLFIINTVNIMEGSNLPSKK